MRDAAFEPCVSTQMHQLLPELDSIWRAHNNISACCIDACFYFAFCGDANSKWTKKKYENTYISNFIEIGGATALHFNQCGGQWCTQSRTKLKSEKSIELHFIMMCCTTARPSQPRETTYASHSRSFYINMAFIVTSTLKRTACLTWTRC